MRNIGDLLGLEEEGLSITIEKHLLPLKEPFVITGYVHTTIQTIRVIVSKNNISGWGEGTSVYYLNETSDGMAEQVEAVADQLRGCCSLNIIQDLLPRGGARNAVDCAYWDYLAKRENTRVAQMIGIDPKPLTSVFTIGIDSVEVMAKNAAAAGRYPILKIKLDDDHPGEKLQAIRQARPEAKLVVDANQGWTVDLLKDLAPLFAELGVEMIEQPIVRGGDADLDGYRSPVPLGVDESCLDTTEYEKVAPFYDVINIKLDKTGGLTEALKLADAALTSGKALMVGNMISSSLGMAPSFHIGQACKFVDLDGPLFLKQDVANGLTYDDGGIVHGPTAELWG
ncbi:MAG: dipeptide epimerase [Pseudomonadota bacterium]